MNDLNIEKRKVSDLKSYPGNPRKISSEMLERLKKSISEFGIVEPLVVNKENQVIGGNQRLKVLKDLKINEVDVVLVKLEKDKEKALNIALNKIQGEWDYLLLKEITEKNDTVLDPFLGSGSTLIAAEKTGRICYGVDLKPEYIDTTLARWEKFTGKKAEKKE